MPFIVISNREVYCFPPSPSAGCRPNFFSRVAPVLTLAAAAGCVVALARLPFRPSLDSSSEPQPDQVAICS